MTDKKFLDVIFMSENKTKYSGTQTEKIFRPLLPENHRRGISILTLLPKQRKKDLNKYQLSF